MQIQTIDAFLTYWAKIRRRSERVIHCIPPDRLEWTFREGKFTLGDLVRHLAALERWMFAENFAGRPSSYPGHGRELAEGWDEVLDFWTRCKDESAEIIGSLPDSRLEEHCTTPAGTEITVWKWMRAMVEHEVHHRGQIYTYLALLEVPTPPLYGLTSEEVLERSEPE